MAAARLKARTSSSSVRTWRARTMWTRRRTTVWVLPEPGPATTSRAGSSAVTASRWGGRHAGDDALAGAGADGGVELLAAALEPARLQLLAGEGEVGGDVGGALVVGQDGVLAQQMDEAELVLVVAGGGGGGGGGGRRSGRRGGRGGSNASVASPTTWAWISTGTQVSVNLAAS